VSFRPNVDSMNVSYDRGGGGGGGRGHIQKKKKKDVASVGDVNHRKGGQGVQRCWGKKNGGARKILHQGGHEPSHLASIQGVKKRLVREGGRNRVEGQRDSISETVTVAGGNGGKVRRFPPV